MAEKLGNIFLTYINNTENPDLVAKIGQQFYKVKEKWPLLKLNFKVSQQIEEDFNIFVIALLEKGRICLKMISREQFQKEKELFAKMLDQIPEKGKSNSQVNIFEQMNSQSDLDNSQITDDQILETWLMNRQIPQFSNIKKDTDWREKFSEIQEQQHFVPRRPVFFKIMTQYLKQIEDYDNDYSEGETTNRNIKNYFLNLCLTQSVFPLVSEKITRIILDYLEESDFFLDLSNLLVFGSQVSFIKEIKTKVQYKPATAKNFCSKLPNEKKKHLEEIKSREMFVMRHNEFIETILGLQIDIDGLSRFMQKNQQHLFYQGDAKAQKAFRKFSQMKFMGMNFMVERRINPQYEYGLDVKQLDAQQLQKIQEQKIKGKYQRKNLSVDQMNMIKQYQNIVENQENDIIQPDNLVLNNQFESVYLPPLLKYSQNDQDIIKKYNQNFIQDQKTPSSYLASPQSYQTNSIDYKFKNVISSVKGENKELKTQRNSSQKLRFEQIYREQLKLLIILGKYLIDWRKLGLLKKIRARQIESDYIKQYELN
ncbi:hypothetical protein PPERSA_11108 [Pseudocohnilembus persalinus]|uniref:Uncharacterized protein n=1 Tax=Pseudocohnilembus persalinus TaxID=266149 RepID=A0A0V0QZ31_PSEPJ|nr:hypothetical protein PPERSA_11108 [Pseudocohnilembus persalinus]|eukprot:KRX07559.1 hypothetical protein PPERSA_11108 [Pseudocohnilembus persalinus]